VEAGEEVEEEEDGERVRFSFTGTQALTSVGEAENEPPEVGRSDSEYFDEIEPSPYTW